MRSTLTIFLLLAGLTGCAAPAGGGGGEGGGDDPLPEYQLGDDAEVDADIGALTEARNEVLVCVGDDTVVTDDETLLGLKQSYAADPSMAPSFPEFVDGLVAPEQARTTEICETTVESASAELAAVIARLTAARNAAAACEGQTATATDESSLDLIELNYLGRSVLAFPTLLEFAEAYVSEFEQFVEEEVCPN